MDAPDPETPRSEETDLEPGASASTVFSTTDSIADLEIYESRARKRLPSGIIQSIIAGEESSVKQVSLSQSYTDVHCY